MKATLFYLIVATIKSSIFGANGQWDGEVGIPFVEKESEAGTLSCYLEGNLRAQNAFQLRFIGAASYIGKKNHTLMEMLNCTTHTKEECPAPLCKWQDTPPEHLELFGVGSCVLKELTEGLASTGLETYYTLLKNEEKITEKIPNELELAQCWMHTGTSREECEKHTDGAGHPCVYCGGIRRVWYNFLGAPLDPAFPSNNRMAFCLSERWAPAGVCDRLNNPMVVTCDTKEPVYDEDDPPTTTSTTTPTVTTTTTTTTTTTSTGIPGTQPNRTTFTATTSGAGIGFSFWHSLAIISSVIYIF